MRPPGGWGEHVPPEAASKPLRVTAGGHTFYVDRVISAVGLGTARSIARAGQTSLATHEPELRAAGKLVDAQSTLTLPAGGRDIMVIGDGATGAWACEAALRAGKDVTVHWVGKHEARSVAPDARAQLAELGLAQAQIETFVTAYNKRNADVFKSIQSGRIKLHSGGLEDAVLEKSSGRVKAQLVGEQGTVDVDGIVSATGQELSLPKGIERERVEFRMVPAKGRVVALDAYDRSSGRALGIRIQGAQMVKATDLVAKSEQGDFTKAIRTQTQDPLVPDDSRAVPGSIYQTNIDVPLANQLAPLKRGEIK